MYILKKKILNLLTASICASFATLGHTEDISTHSGSNANNSLFINQLGRAINIPNNQIESFLPGLYAAKDTYGMRTRAVVAAFQSNPSTPFNVPIAGFRYVKSLAEYQDRDSVSLYADNTSPPYRNWEIITKANYTPTSFTSKEIDSTKILPGMIIDTDHNPPWASIVVSVKNNKVITSGWVNLKTKHLGTPPNNVGLKINKLSKIWTTNFNAFLLEDSKSESMVISENAIVNNKIAKPNTILGMDTVVLPQSKYGGTSAYLSRPAVSGNKQQWQFGFMSQGSSTANFISLNSSQHQPSIGYYENSSAAIGLKFQGANKDHSIAWTNKKTGEITAAIDKEGNIEKHGYVTQIINGSLKLSDMIGRYIVGTSDNIILTLPEKNKIFAGYTLKITKVNSNISAVRFISLDGTAINNGKNFTQSGGRWNVEIIYDGNNWYIV